MEHDPIPHESDSSDDRRLRLRAVLAEYRPILIVALLATAAMGGWLCYGAYAAQPETTEVRTDEAWSLSGELHHSAEVVDSTTLYAAGTVLEDRPRYFTAVTPTADGEYAVTYEAHDGTADVDVSIDRYVQAVEGNTVYWESAEPVASTTQTDVEPGETVTVDLDVPVADVVDRIETIQAELGARPGETSVFLQATVSVEGSIAGAERSTSETHRIPVTIDGGTYGFDDETITEPYRDAETVTVSDSAGPIESVGGPLLLLAGLGGLGGVAVATRRYHAPTTAEREWLDYCADVDEHGELVTPASLPAAVTDRPRASVESLAHLAQLAIDLRTGLHYDPLERTYLVVDDEILYSYDPPRPPQRHSSRTVDGSPAVSPDRGSKTGGIVLTSDESSAGESAPDEPDDGVLTANSDGAGSNDDGPDES
ncbi:hypothetical protein Halru_0551 [Halovivax ruber XH-70]|uniref:DUF5305 domain-containing protein n=1 Tax=Halovivax ruber (strain DSM 18193 / JCM 13892 / XH-70) TaxID=797302 RepID=L0I8Z7_HALRX|nr:DUF5305 domain-containing protein [Halovivax ruber]AGB15184.1 hypothetical protein Halru_0551 [Halovivax ruber XH-70]